MPNSQFAKIDIYDFDAIYKLMQEEHVDRSVKNTFTFARNNVMDALLLLQAAKLYWESLPEKYEGKCFTIYQLTKFMVP